MLQIITTTTVISLIVLAYNHFEKTTEKCLLRLDQYNCDDVGLTIVDNNSTDALREKLLDFCEPEDYPIPVLSDRSFGFAGDMNLGALALPEHGWFWLTAIQFSLATLLNNLKTFYSAQKSISSDS